MTRADEATACATRLDKWLWHARFFRTRGLATRAVAAGAIRVNARRVTKPATTIAPGDVLTFVTGGQVRVVRVTALAPRRGPATQARSLYAELPAATEGSANS